MFLTKVLATTLVLLTLTPATALACPELKNPQSDAYGRRDNNRCEGLKSRDASSVEFDLISFVTFGSNLETNQYSEKLSLKIPNLNDLKPQFEMKSSVRNYYLDNLSFQNTSRHYIFNLPTRILRRFKIPISQLQATAYISARSQKVYLPVILGKPSGKYKFVLGFPQRISFPTLEIRRNGKVLPDSQKPQLNPRNRQAVYIWNYQKAPKGRYELYVVAKKGKQERSYSFFFEHNPDSLK